MQLTAQIAERDVMRYSPAGVPIVNLTLQHESQQQEAGIVRTVTLEINAMAAGEIASRVAELPLTAPHQFVGFLAKRNRNSRSLVFHIIDFAAVTS